MKKTYTVIWFDDEHQERKKIRGSAHLKGIQLIGFGNAEDGIKELEQNIEAYDAALLDGIFYETSSEKGRPTEDKAMGKVAKKLLQLESRKKIPWFILSGQNSFTKDENRFAASFKEGKVYDKLGGDEEYEELWNTLIEEANKLPDVQLKHKYNDLLEVCSDNLLGSDNYSRLFNLIKQIETYEKLDRNTYKLNEIRMLIERMFKRMAKKGIIPEEIISNKGWISKSSLFLSGLHSEYSYLNEIVHPTVGENIHRLLNITQDGSHDGEGDHLKLKVDDFLTRSKSDYLYRSCVFLLFDILLWFKEFMESNDDKDVNIARWKKKENYGDWITGIVIRIADNGWGTLRLDNDVFDNEISVPKSIVNENSLNENDKVEVTTKPSPDGKKTHIISIKKLITPSS